MAFLAAGRSVVPLDEHIWDAMIYHGATKDSLTFGKHVCSCSLMETRYSAFLAVEDRSTSRHSPPETLLAIHTTLSRSGVACDANHS